MHHKMTLGIKNWQLNLLALLLITILTSLGFWQLSRAKEKTVLLKTYSARAQAPALTTKTLPHMYDWRFYKVDLIGEFDNAHTFLLDNKTYQGRVGFEVYTPFWAEGEKRPILIDRGFIPLTSRQTLPVIPPLSGKMRVSGLLNLPPNYASFGEIHHGTLTWPLLIEFMNLSTLGNLMEKELAPYIVNLEPDHPGALAITWQIVMIPPERHQGYAVQWFALALTLLILSIALNRRSTK